MTSIEKFFKFTIFCDEKSAMECTRHCIIKVSTPQIAELINEKIVEVLEVLAYDVSDSKKEGTIYNFGSMTESAIVDDINKLIKLYLEDPEAVTSVVLTDI